MIKTLNTLSYIFLLPLYLITLYLGLFHNNAAQNLTIISTLPNYFLISLNIFIILFLIPLSLKLMNVVTGETGLERFKIIFAISLGMITLSFTFLQFINAIATSSAEGATVVVEIIQQIAHLSESGQLEEYGLIGMLTSDASGPWNSSIFPLIIILVWMLRGKKARVEINQLHIPMIFQFVLYAQQFLFALDLKYTLFEIILMAITGTLFIAGMFSFLIDMFAAAEDEEKKANNIASKFDSTKSKDNNKKPLFYSRAISYLANRSFEMLTFNPSNKKAEINYLSVVKKRVGFGKIGKAYVLTNALQLTLAMTTAMFMLVLSVQFLFAQFNMSDAEAALFGTAGLTSAPEALVALVAGPYINSLLLVGSNIIDGWFSAIGQTILLTYAEIVSQGAITSIPLHPAIRYLTFLSWTQGILVWAVLYIYGRSSAKDKMSHTISIFAALGLLVSIIYYFGGAWFSAQALGYQAEYALNSAPFKALTLIIDTLQQSNIQTLALIINVIGLTAVVFWWSGIMNKIKRMTKASDFEKTYSQKINELMKKFNITENQHVLLFLDKTTSMDDSVHLFKNKWIDIILESVGNLALLLDDDAHVHVYTTYENHVHEIPHLLTTQNIKTYVDDYVGRDTHDKIKYSEALKTINNHYEKITNPSDSTMVLFITDGYGTDYDEMLYELKKLSDKKIFVHFIIAYGKKIPKSIKKLEQVRKKIKGGTFSYSLLSASEFSRGSIIQDHILGKYSEYLETKK